MSNEVKCPKCGSNQFAANQKGFSSGKAIGGAILTGGVGLLAGFIGSKKVIITCLACGNKFKPGEGLSNEEKAEIANKEIEQKRKELQESKENIKEVTEKMPYGAQVLTLLFLMGLFYLIINGC